MDLGEIGWGGIYWIGLAQDRDRCSALVNMVRHRWVDNIKMNLGKIGWGGIDWIGLAQDGDKWSTRANAVMNFRVA
jgi:hypothetical protein